MTMAEARKRSGLRQADVSEKLGVTMGCVAAWDTGRALPRAALLPKIAQLYGCTVDELLDKNTPG